MSVLKLLPNAALVFCFPGRSSYRGGTYCGPCCCCCCCCCSAAIDRATERAPSDEGGRADNCAPSIAALDRHPPAIAPHMRPGRCDRRSRHHRASPSPAHTAERRHGTIAPRLSPAALRQHRLSRGCTHTPAPTWSLSRPTASTTHAPRAHPLASPTDRALSAASAIASMLSSPSSAGPHPMMHPTRVPEVYAPPPLIGVGPHVDPRGG